MVKFKRKVDSGVLYSVKLKEDSSNDSYVLGVSDDVYYIKNKSTGSSIIRSSSFNTVADLVSVADSIK